MRVSSRRQTKCDHCAVRQRLVVKSAKRSIYSESASYRIKRAAIYLAPHYFVGSVYQFPALPLGPPLLEACQIWTPSIGPP